MTVKKQGSAEFPVLGNSAVYRHVPKKKPQTSKGTKSALPLAPETCSLTPIHQ
jgi:hypothetical protein